MSNFNLNKVILGGRIANDVELKQTQTGVPVCSFSIAVNRRFAGKEAAQQTDFFNVTAWRATAEFVSKYFKKGSSICVVGSLQNRSWTDQQGQKRYATDILADEVQFVDSKSDAQGGTAAPTTNYMPEAYTGAQTADFEAVAQDADLPF